MASNDDDDDGEEDFAYFRKAPPKLKGKRGGKKSGGTRSAMPSSSPVAGSSRSKRVAAAAPATTERPVKAARRISGSPLRGTSHGKKASALIVTTTKRGHIMSFSSSSSASSSSSSSESSEAEGGFDDASDSDSSPPPLTEKEKKARAKAALRETRTSKRARENDRHDEETVVLPSRSAAKGKGKEKGKGRQQDSSDETDDEATTPRTGKASAASAPAWQPRKRPRAIPTASQMLTQQPPPILAAAPIHDKGPPSLQSRGSPPGTASSRHRDISRASGAPVNAPTVGPVADVYQLLDDSDDDDDADAEQAKEVPAGTEGAAHKDVDSVLAEAGISRGTRRPPPPDEDENDPFGLEDLYYLPPPLRESSHSVEEAGDTIEESEHKRPPHDEVALAPIYNQEGDGCLDWIMDDAEAVSPDFDELFVSADNVDALADAGAAAPVPADTDASHPDKATPENHVRPELRESEETDDRDPPTPPSVLAKTSRFFQQASGAKPSRGASSASPAEQKGKAVRATPQNVSLSDRKDVPSTGSRSRHGAVIEPEDKEERSRMVETPEAGEERSSRQSATKSKSTGKSGRFRYQDPTELDVGSASSHKRSADASIGASSGVRRKRRATERDYGSPSQASQHERGRKAGGSDSDHGVVESMPCDLCMQVFPVIVLPDHVRECADAQSNAPGSDIAGRTAATMSHTRSSARQVPLRRTDGAIPPPRRVPIEDGYKAPEEPDLAATLFPSPPSAKRKASSKQRGISTEAQVQNQSYNGDGWEDYPAEMDAETSYGGRDRDNAGDWQPDAASNPRPVASTTRAGVPPARPARSKGRASSQISRAHQQQQQIINIEDDDDDAEDDIEEVESHRASASRDKGKGCARAESPIPGDIRISELPSPIRRGYYKMLNLDEDGRPNGEVDTERVAKGSALNTAWKGKLQQERYRAGAAASGAAKKSWGTGRKGGGRKKSFTAKGTGRGRPKKR